MVLILWIFAEWKIMISWTFSLSSILIVLLTQECVFLLKMVQMWQFNNLGQTTIYLIFCQFSYFQYTSNIHWDLVNSILFLACLLLIIAFKLEWIPPDLWIKWNTVLTYVCDCLHLYKVCLLCFRYLTGLIPWYPFDPSYSKATTILVN